MRYLSYLLLVILLSSCGSKQEHIIQTFKCKTPDVVKPEYLQIPSTPREALQALINNYGMCLEYSKQLEAANAVCK